MRTHDLVKRADELIQMADSSLSQTYQSSGVSRLKPEPLALFRTSALSFIRNVYGDAHSYYADFEGRVTHNHIGAVQYGRGVISAIRNELAGGWTSTVKGLLSAEIFSNFLEMAAHLMAERYKDAAAVMIGSVLEQHLRQLANNAGIAIVSPDGRSKRADSVNVELSKNGIYNMLDQKQVTAWLELRNKAAHGDYEAYTHDQVQGMLDGVTGFMSRVRP